MKTTLQLEIETEIELPLLPNFIRRADGTTIDVKDLTEHSLQQIGYRWQQALVIHAEERRKKNP